MPEHTHRSRVFLISGRSKTTYVSHLTLHEQTMLWIKTCGILQVFCTALLVLGYRLNHSKWKLWPPIYEFV